LAQFQVSPWQTKYSQLLVTEIESIWVFSIIISKSSGK
jgi:hypothetical protein